MICGIARLKLEAGSRILGSPFLATVMLVLSLLVSVLVPAHLYPDAMCIFNNLAHNTNASSLDTLRMSSYITEQRRLAVVRGLPFIILTWQGLMVHRLPLNLKQDFSFPRAQSNYKALISR